MDEHARLHVSGGVDVQVAAAAGDTSAYKLAVVLEVERHEDKSQGMADSDMHKFEKQGRILKNGD